MKKPVLHANHSQIRNVDANESRTDTRSGDDASRKEKKRIDDKLSTVVENAKNEKSSKGNPKSDIDMSSQPPHKPR